MKRIALCLPAILLCMAAFAQSPKPIGDFSMEQTPQPTITTPAVPENNDLSKHTLQRGAPAPTGEQSREYNGSNWQIVYNNDLAVDNNKTILDVQSPTNEWTTGQGY